MSGQHVIQCKSNIQLSLRAHTPAFGFIVRCMVIVGLWSQIWMRLRVNRGISNIIARDLSIMVSNYIHSPFPASGSCAAFTVLVSLGADYLGCTNLARENDKRHYTYILHMYIYGIKRPATKLHS